MPFEPMSLEDVNRCLAGNDVRPCIESVHSMPCVRFIRDDYGDGRFELWDDRQLGVMWLRDDGRWVFRLSCPSDYAMKCLEKQALTLNARKVFYRPWSPERQDNQRVDFFRLPNFSLVTTLRIYAVRASTFIMNVGDMPQLISLCVRYVGLSRLPDEFVSLVKLQNLYLDFERFEEVPAVLAKLPNLKLLSIRENPLCVAPLFLCETGLVKFKATVTEAFKLFGFERYQNLREKCEDIDMTMLRRMYHEFHWRRKVHELVWQLIPQPIVEEAESELMYCDEPKHDDPDKTCNIERFWEQKQPNIVKRRAEAKKRRDSKNAEKRRSTKERNVKKRRTDE